MSAVSNVVGEVASPILGSGLDAKIEAARTILRYEIEKLDATGGMFRDVCVTSSFQAEDMVVVHMVRTMLPDVPVLFLDTGYHFSETYEYRDRMASEWRLNLVNILPEQTVAEQEAQFGILNQTAPDRCCGMRKVGPLFAALAPYALWFTGMRREQAKTRANLQAVDTFALPGGKVLRKISLLAEWTTRDVWHYAGRFEIPLLSLYDRGYSSIGCQPCTSLPIDPNDPRSGRWGGQKLECGIHIQPAS
jgi:phosphoadenosine phosphosulfate reductase